MPVPVASGEELRPLPMESDSAADEEELLDSSVSLEDPLGQA